MAAPAHLTPGTLFARDYRVERALAEGGMGAVYVVEQLSTGSRRALKVMHPNLVPDQKSRDRFVAEARVGARIGSEHVVEVLAAGVDEPTGIPFLVMELLDGDDLEQLVRARGALPPAEVLDLLQQVGHGLGRAHALGIVHRDLKPENLFLAQTRRRTGTSIVKILDFGIAQTLEGNRTAATVTSAIGSPLWMAPEQAQPGAMLRPATDVWALGLIAFYLLAGKSYWRAANHATFNLAALLVEVMTHPIEPPSVRAAELGAKIPSGLDAWFLRCLDRDPGRRYPDAQQAIDALTAVLEAGVAPTHALRPSPVAGTLAMSPPHSPYPPSGGPVPSWAPSPLSAEVSPPPQRSARGPLLGCLVAAVGLGVVGAVMAGSLALWAVDEGPSVPALEYPQTRPQPAPAGPEPTAPQPLPAPAPPPPDLPRPPREAAPRAPTSSGGAAGPTTRSRPPRVRSGSAAVRGALSSQAIRRVMRRHTGEVQGCYERGLRDDPALTGRVVLSITISPTGAVSAAQVVDSNLGSPSVEECLVRSVRRWTFPAPEGGGVVIVRYPLVLSPG